MLNEFLRHIVYSLNPWHYPSYFQTPALSTFAGDPLHWEIAVLVVFAVVTTIAFRSDKDRLRWQQTVLLCLAPVFVGLVGMAYIVHRFNFWLGLSPAGEVLMVASLFPVHIGSFCGAVVAIVIALKNWRCDARSI